MLTDIQKLNAVENALDATKLQIVDTGVEACENDNLQKPAPYYAKIIGEINNGKGYWKYLKVGIFERESGNQIGEYKYNYSSIARTFHPFQLRSKWYALYSTNYTATRLMELPSCKDIGGETPESGGFCPTDYWVPPLHYLDIICFPECPRYISPTHPPDYTKACTCKGVQEHKWHFPDRIHGFIAGCVWGDDSSLKIQYLDLSRADEGILKREERFGYAELPNKLHLNEAIELDVDDDGEVDWMTISIQKHIHLATGKEDE